MNLGEPSLKKTGKIWEKFPKGGGLKKTEENSQFQFGNLKNLGGGGLNFSKMSDFQLFCNITFIRNVWNSKSSEFDPRGGGLEVFKKFWNSESSELSEGGGSSLIGNFSQIFPFFFSDASPKSKIWKKKNKNKT